MSEGREQAQKAFDTFLKTYGAKYPKGSECLLKDRDPLLVLYDFPAEHWIHIQTTNPIESTLMFKLGLCAEKRWRKNKGLNHLALILEGKTFKDWFLESNSKLEAA